MPKPRVIDPGDVVIKVTGSTICGSDVHLYHGMNSTMIGMHRYANSICCLKGSFPNYRKAMYSVTNAAELWRV